jgi:hypothetical protein
MPKWWEASDGETRGFAAVGAIAVVAALCVLGFLAFVTP